MEEALNLEGKRQFNAHVREAKQLEGKLAVLSEDASQEALDTLLAALDAYESALEIDTTNKKLQKKILKLRKKEVQLAAAQQMLQADAAAPLQDATNAPASFLAQANKASHAATPPRTPRGSLDHWLVRTPASTSAGPIAPPTLPRTAPDFSALTTEEAAECRSLAADAPHQWSFDEARGGFTLPGGLLLAAGTFRRLYPHQREGVAWMWALHPSSCSKPVFSAFGVDLLGDAKRTLRAQGVRVQEAGDSALWGGGEEQIEGGAAAQARSVLDDMPMAVQASSGFGSSHEDGGIHAVGEGGGRVASATVTQADLVAHADVVRGRAGGILGDDMGLGKTVQVSAFLGALLAPGHGAARSALILAPTSIIPTWQAELGKFAPHLPVQVYQGTAAERRRALGAVQRQGGVLLATYGMLTHNAEELSVLAAEKKPKKVSSSKASAWGRAARALGGGGAAPGAAPLPAAPAGSLFTWGAMVLDEGHKVKNTSTKIAKAVRVVSCQYRLLLSGTPLQNRLDELWALMDFVTRGALLGNKKRFNADFANLIVASRERGADERLQREGQLATALLRARIAPHFLRREKGSMQGPGQAGGATLTPGLSASKMELVAWCRLSPLQLALYTAFLESSDIKRVLLTSTSPLAVLSILKKVCQHALLLGPRERQRVLACLIPQPAGAASAEDQAEYGEDVAAALECVEEEGGASEEEAAISGTWVQHAMQKLASSAEPKSLAVDMGCSPEQAAAVAQLAQLSAQESVQTLVQSCGKLQFLQEALRVFRAEGARALVFSSSKVMLGVVQRLLQAQGVKHLRIDGDISDMRERQRIVDTFNADDSYDVCLLTTGVGALGLTLTGASRVVILDPSWNPSTDAQAVDRAYRMGQTRDVVTYRCITCGTMEEKQYRLQVFKGGVTQSVLGHGGGGGAAAPSGRVGAGAGGYKRYLTRSELRDMFILGCTTASETAQLLGETQAAPAPPPKDSEFGRHLEQVQGGAAGGSLVDLSRHDHLYALDARAATALSARLAAALTPAKGLRQQRRRRGSSANCSTPGSDTEHYSASVPAEGVYDSSVLVDDALSIAPSDDEQFPDIWQEASPTDGNTIASPQASDCVSPGGDAAASPQAIGYASLVADDSPCQEAVPKNVRFALCRVHAAAQLSSGMVPEPSDASVQQLSRAWLDALNGAQVSLVQARTAAEEYRSAVQLLEGCLEGEALLAATQPAVQRAQAIKHAVQQHIEDCF